MFETAVIQTTCPFLIFAKANFKKEKIINYSLFIWIKYNFEYKLNSL